MPKQLDTSTVHHHSPRKEYIICALFSPGTFSYKHSTQTPTHHNHQLQQPTTNNMCLITTTTYTCVHETYRPAAPPCPHYLRNYSIRRWPTVLQCPYKQFVVNHEARPCPGCTTEFGLNHIVRGSHESDDEQERAKTPEKSPIKKALGWISGLWK
jgi:hypothetical protein